MPLHKLSFLSERRSLAHELKLNITYYIMLLGEVKCVVHEQSVIVRVRIVSLVSILAVIVIRQWLKYINICDDSKAKQKYRISGQAVTPLWSCQIIATKT